MSLNPAVLYPPVPGDALGYSHGRTGPLVPPCRVTSPLHPWSPARSHPAASPPPEPARPLAAAGGGEGLPAPACGWAGRPWEGSHLASLTVMMQKKKREILSLSFDDDYVGFDKYRVLLLVLILRFSVCNPHLLKLSILIIISRCVFMFGTERFFVFFVTERLCVWAHSRWPLAVRIMSVCKAERKPSVLCYRWKQREWSLILH